MKDKKIKKIHHDGHKLNSIKEKIINHGYDSLSENEILFISKEIESHRLSIEEVEAWMKHR